MDDTKSRILSAAMKAVRQYGLEGVRIQKISELAGLSPGTLYRYFDGKDQLMLECFTYVDKQAAEIEKYKQAAKEAQETASKKIQERDQRDYLKGEFDKLGIESGRVRDSLMREIMGDDGLKWKDGAFMGLSDYLAKENEKDHFYQTEDEKKAAADKAAEEEAKQKAAEIAPKFTDKSEPKRELAKETGAVPLLF